jgi:hypothetical protein
MEKQMNTLQHSEENMTLQTTTLPQRETPARGTRCYRMVPRS